MSNTPGALEKAEAAKAQCNRQLVQTAIAGGKAATSVPGTSITGPVPTSKTDVVVGGTATIITGIVYH